MRDLTNSKTDSLDNARLKQLAPTPQSEGGV